MTLTPHSLQKCGICEYADVVQFKIVTAQKQFQSYFRSIYKVSKYPQGTQMWNKQKL